MRVPGISFSQPIAEVRPGTSSTNIRMQHLRKFILVFFLSINSILSKAMSYKERIEGHREVDGVSVNVIKGLSFVAALPVGKIVIAAPFSGV